MQNISSDPSSLENLRDIAVLDRVPLWPLAPGWYVVGVLLLLIILCVTWSLIRRWQTQRYRREALAELNRLEAAFHDPARRASALGALPALVKRVALAVWPRQTVASLSGLDFLEFLDTTGHTQAFTNGPGSCLPQLAYDPRIVTTVDDARIAQLFGAIRTWVRTHRRVSTDTV